MGDGMNPFSFSTSYIKRCCRSGGARPSSSCRFEPPQKQIMLNPSGDLQASRGALVKILIKTVSIVLAVFSFFEIYEPIGVTDSPMPPGRATMPSGPRRGQERAA